MEVQCKNDYWEFNKTPTKCRIEHRIHKFVPAQYLQKPTNSSIAMNNRPTLDSNRIIWIKKSSGEEEQFAIYKLERSLRNAGADNESIEVIVSDIESWITTGVTTKQIYTRAFQILRRQKTNSASRYKLKQAMLELGTTGYPFEQFIGQLFEAQGFDVQVGQILDGCCVTHEVDVIATGKNVQNLVECKYSQTQGKTGERTGAVVCSLSCR
jgi:hypothetical protein